MGDEKEAQWVFTDVQSSSIIHYSLKTEATQVTFDRWRDHIQHSMCWDAGQSFKQKGFRNIYAVEPSISF